MRQYEPWRYACDTFEESPVTRTTARLLQLSYDEDGAPGDLWLPYYVRKDLRPPLSVQDLIHMRTSL